MRQVSIDKLRLAEMQLSCSAKTTLRLIKGLRLWSDSRSAKRLRFQVAGHAPTGHDLTSADKLLKAADMKRMGGGYVG